MNQEVENNMEILLADYKGLMVKIYNETVIPNWRPLVN